MATFVSDFFGIDDELATLGVFDSILDEDSNFFINLVRLKTTRVPEFENSYEKINTFFGGIATLLNAAERLIHLGAKHYIKTNNLDMSFEPDAGRGPADFKMSRGDDITVCEVKLSSNTQYLHGYLVQIEEYALAEGTKQRVFVFVDIGNPGRLKK